MNTPTCPIHMCEMVLVSASEPILRAFSNDSTNSKERPIWRCPIPEESGRMCRRVAAAEQQYRPVICKKCGVNECEPEIISYSKSVCKPCLAKREKRNRLALQLRRRLNAQKAALA